LSSIEAVKNHDADLATDGGESVVRVLRRQRRESTFVAAEASEQLKARKTHEHGDGLFSIRLLAVVGVLGLSNIVVEALGDGDGELVVHPVETVYHGLLHLTAIAL